MPKQDWFYSKYSNAQLAAILSVYSKEVTGSRQYVNGGRCTLANALEALDARQA